MGAGTKTGALLLPTSIVEAAAEYGLSLKGWFIDAADAPLAAFKDEEHPERTVEFFNDALTDEERDLLLASK